MVERITIDIEGLREPLDRVCARYERSLSQQIRFFIRQGLETVGESEDIQGIIKKVLGGEKLESAETNKLKNYFKID
jgi:hypothetical protein